MTCKQEAERDAYISALGETTFSRGHTYEDHPDVQDLMALRLTIDEAPPKDQLCLLILAHAMGEVAIAAFAALLTKGSPRVFYVNSNTGASASSASTRPGVYASVDFYVFYDFYDFYEFCAFRLRGF